MDKLKLRLGVIGCGRIVERSHLPALLHIPYVEVVALVDTDAGRARTLAANFCVPRFETDYTAICDDVDAVIVAVPNHLHGQVSCDLLKRGVHVLCEKPMAMNVAECRAMIEAGRQGGAQLMINHSRRFRANVSLLKQVIDRRLIGAPVEFEGSLGYPFDWPSVTGFYFKHDLAGGGALMDQGPHLLEIMRWLLGEAEAVEEYRAEAAPDSNTETTAYLHLRLQDGIPGRLTVSWARLLPNFFAVRGTRGWARIDMGGRCLVEVYSDQAKACAHWGPLTIQVPENDPIRAALEAFVNAIRYHEVPPVPGEAGLHVLTIIESCYRGTTL